jgi:hypothetical protein
VAGRVTLPTELKAGALTYRISDNRDEMLAACRNELADLLGHTDRRRCVILIEPDQADCQKRDTLLHETLHIVADLAGLADEWGAKKEETTVSRLSPVLLQVLRDNPKLLAYLTEP